MRLVFSDILSGSAQQSGTAHDLWTLRSALGLVAAAGLTLGGLVCGGLTCGGAAVAGTPTQDVQMIGLAPLYEALFAVANCPNVALDEPAFRHAARLYHLSTIDLKIDGPFATEIAALTDQYRVRIEDDRAAFCSVNRLQFSIPYGVLVDRGPVVPHPLPFATSP